MSTRLVYRASSSNAILTIILRVTRRHAKVDSNCGELMEQQAAMCKKTILAYNNDISAFNLTCDWWTLGDYEGKRANDLCKYRIWVTVWSCLINYIVFLHMLRVLFIGWVLLSGFLWGPVPVPAPVTPEKWSGVLRRGSHVAVPNQIPEALLKKRYDILKNFHLWFIYWLATAKTTGSTSWHVGSLRVQWPSSEGWHLGPGICGFFVKYRSYWIFISLQTFSVSGIHDEFNNCLILSNPQISICNIHKPASKDETLECRSRSGSLATRPYRRGRVAHRNRWRRQENAEIGEEAGMKGTPTMNFSILLITTFLQRCEEPSSFSFSSRCDTAIEEGETPLPSIFTHDTTRQKAEGDCYFVSILFLFDAMRGLLPFLSFLRGEVAFASLYTFFSFLFGATRAMILFCFRHNEVGFPLFSARREVAFPPFPWGAVASFFPFHFDTTRAIALRCSFYFIWTRICHAAAMALTTKYYLEVDPYNLEVSILSDFGLYEASRSPIANSALHITLFLRVTESLSRSTSPPLAGLVEISE